MDLWVCPGAGYSARQSTTAETRRSKPPSRGQERDNLVSNRRFKNSREKHHSRKIDGLFEAHYEREFQAQKALLWFVHELGRQ